MRALEDIVPRTDEEEILLHIHAVLVDIRHTLQHMAGEEHTSPALADGVVTQDEASEAAVVLATHGSQTAPKKTVKKTARKKTA